MGKITRIALGVLSAMALLFAASGALADDGQGWPRDAPDSADSQFAFVESEGGAERVVPDHEPEADGSDAAETPQEIESCEMTAHDHDQASQDEESVRLDAAQPDAIQLDEEERMRERFVTVVRVMPDIMRAGDRFTLKAVLTGFEDVEYMAQWQMDAGMGWVDVAGGGGLTLRVAADPANVNFRWRIVVTLCSFSSMGSPEGNS